MRIIRKACNSLSCTLLLIVCYLFTYRNHAHYRHALYYPEHRLAVLHSIRTGLCTTLSTALGIHLSACSLESGIQFSHRRVNSS